MSDDFSAPFDRNHHEASGFFGLFGKIGVRLHLVQKQDTLVRGVFILGAIGNGWSLTGVQDENVWLPHFLVGAMKFEMLIMNVFLV